MIHNFVTLQEGEIKERIRQSLEVYEEALLKEDDKVEDSEQQQQELFQKCFQLLTQLPQLAPSCPLFILTNMVRMLELGQKR